MFGRQYQQQPPNHFSSFSEDSYSPYMMNSYHQNQMPFPPYTQDHYPITVNDYSPQQVNAYHPYNQTSPSHYSNYPNEYMDSFYGSNNPNWFTPYQTPPPKANKQSAGFLSQFQAASGQIDVNKMLSTVGQLANTVQQVTPMLKQLSNFIKKG